MNRYSSFHVNDLIWYEAVIKLTKIAESHFTETVIRTVLQNDHSKHYFTVFNELIQMN